MRRETAKESEESELLVELSSHQRRAPCEETPHRQICHDGSSTCRTREVGCESVARNFISRAAALSVSQASPQIKPRTNGIGSGAAASPTWKKAGAHRTSLR